MNGKLLSEILDSHPQADGLHTWKYLEEQHREWKLNQLSTLIQESNKEAVEGFVREFNNKCLHDSINDSYNYPLEEVPNVVYNFMDTYLSSIGKDGE